MYRSLLAVLLASASSAQDGGAQSSPGKTVWDGVYTTAQATRGEAAFNSDCRSCHRNNFQGPRFIERWREDRLSSLFNFMRTKMPLDAPGSASEDEYLDIVAYMLSLNSFPSGAQELSSSAAGSIQVVGKEGPAPLPSGSLVRVVGCLVHGPGDEWTLSRASDLVRTREQEKSTGAELKASEAQSLGTHTLRLPEIEFYHPDPHKGHKVETKGFLDRDPEGERLLVTSLQSLADSCPE
jgi:mono/diheme cytochrome c family protein